MKNKFVNIILYGIECIGFIALLVLEYLSGYKAGVMKHLYFKKMEYLAKVYTQDSMMVHSIILVVLFIGVLLICKRRLNCNCKRSIIMFAVYSIVLVTAFYMPYMKELNTYAYILIVLEASIAIETIRVIINK
ncbi:hypothetical protein [Tepidibacter hydrothermalis]|uniref:DUF2127 domain-containing protein n=1 Tax=Tepidibacter hydrothermalis TaxID=3036126 RepID=A0ABY8EFC5_9FIRM|nr:hypothetical protein [Tepidibacter hydrothermalis]WFD10182.1 hypothetical protein P4S50_17770 [Tepidibacter hydrothermalis]